MAPRRVGGGVGATEAGAIPGNGGAGTVSKTDAIKEAVAGGITSPKDYRRLRQKEVRPGRQPVLRQPPQGLAGEGGPCPAQGEGARPASRTGEESRGFRPLTVEDLAALAKLAERAGVERLQEFLEALRQVW